MFSLRLARVETSETESWLLRGHVHHSRKPGRSILEIDLHMKTWTVLCFFFLIDKFVPSVHSLQEIATRANTNPEAK